MHCNHFALCLDLEVVPLCNAARHEASRVCLSWRGHAQAAAPSPEHGAGQHGAPSGAHVTCHVRGGQHASSSGVLLATFVLPAVCAAIVCVAAHLALH